ncbi:MAG TPA: SIS domain-containing protein [Candidatus Limnocylindrales bacterium]|nr:SIS domain-containing protein [Candidatus Limnocylindrales bacterium]
MTEPFVPELRSRRPWVIEEMIASQPSMIEAMGAEAVREAVASVARLVVAAAQAGQPIVVSGCGTSEHGAMAVAVQLRLALQQAGSPAHTVRIRQAFEAWLEPQTGGVHIGVSHEGETAATNAAMEHAAATGARVAAITAKRESRAAGLADVTIVTPQHDRSWCHTIGYLSPILAGALLAHEIVGAQPPILGLAETARQALELRDEAAELGGRLARAADMLVVGSGVDAIAARELALKVREGARLRATGYPLETILHGHLAAAEATDALVVILTEPAPRPARLTRTKQVLMAAREIGMATAVVAEARLAAELENDGLASAGSLPLPPGQQGAAAALVASAVGLQLLTVGLAAARGTNPDRIRREEEPYARAAAAAESAGLTG